MESLTPVEFTVLTYNIDGMNYLREERLKAFLDKIEQDPRPDIVFIQEGSRLTYEKLLREMNLLGYKRQLLDIMNSRDFGELIFSKFPLSDGKYFPFVKSFDNRGVSCVKVDIKGTNIWICTSQFDKQTALYRMQLNNLSSTLRLLPKNENVIFGGDTRILEYQSDLCQPEGWYDSWYECGNIDNKYTYDSNTNFLTKAPYKDRPDVIWFRPNILSYNSSNIKLECIESNLYGKDSDVGISSHYGVIATFKLS
jgi:exonuclease III